MLPDGAHNARTPDWVPFVITNRASSPSVRTVSSVKPRDTPHQSASRCEWHGPIPSLLFELSASGSLTTAEGGQLKDLYKDPDMWQPWLGGGTGSSDAKSLTSCARVQFLTPALPNGSLLPDGAPMSAVTAMCALPAATEADAFAADGSLTTVLSAADMMAAGGGVHVRVMHGLVPSAAVRTSDDGVRSLLDTLVAAKDSTGIVHRPKETRPHHAGHPRDVRDARTERPDAPMSFTLVVASFGANRGTSDEANPRSLGALVVTEDAIHLAEALAAVGAAVLSPGRPREEEERAGVPLSVGSAEAVSSDRKDLGMSSPPRSRTWWGLSVVRARPEPRVRRGHVVRAAAIVATEPSVTLWGAALLRALLSAIMPPPSMLIKVCQTCGNTWSKPVPDTVSRAASKPPAVDVMGTSTQGHEPLCVCPEPMVADAIELLAQRVHAAACGISMAARSLCGLKLSPNHGADQSGPCPCCLAVFSEVAPKMPCDVHSSPERGWSYARGLGRVLRATIPLGPQRENLLAQRVWRADAAFRPPTNAMAAALALSGFVVVSPPRELTGTAASAQSTYNGPVALIPCLLTLAITSTEVPVWPTSWTSTEALPCSLVASDGYLLRPCRHVLSGRTSLRAAVRGLAADAAAPFAIAPAVWLAEVPGRLFGNEIRDASVVSSGSSPGGSASHALTSILPSLLSPTPGVMSAYLPRDEPRPGEPRPGEGAIPWVERLQDKLRPDDQHHVSSWRPWRVAPVASIEEAKQPGVSAHTEDMVHCRSWCSSPSSVSWKPFTTTTGALAARLLCHFGPVSTAQLIHAFLGDQRILFLSAAGPASLPANFVLALAMLCTPPQLSVSVYARRIFPYVSIAHRNVVGQTRGAVFGSCNRMFETLGATVADVIADCDAAMVRSVTSSAGSQRGLDGAARPAEAADGESCQPSDVASEVGGENSLYASSFSRLPSPAKWCPLQPASLLETTLAVLHARLVVSVERLVTEGARAWEADVDRLESSARSSSSSMTSRLGESWDEQYDVSEGPESTSVGSSNAPEALAPQVRPPGLGIFSHGLAAAQGAISSAASHGLQGIAAAQSAAGSAATAIARRRRYRLACTALKPAASAALYFTGGMEDEVRHVCTAMVHDLFCVISADCAAGDAASTTVRSALGDALFAWRRGVTYAAWQAERRYVDVAASHEYFVLRQPSHDAGTLSFMVANRAASGWMRNLRESASHKAGSTRALECLQGLLHLVCSPVPNDTDMNENLLPPPGHVALLGAMSDVAGGAAPLASLVLHEDHTLQMVAAAILLELSKNEEGRATVGAMNMFLRRAVATAACTVAAE
eukprot:TRINITY_DN68085_c0_g1_i1.p1 TRINITY_DN68085_c0_g1~~TRINITY_DN68085_c0_g1_i1.p1  ORF type:complete len:1414 (+),score=78.64 TRINITY_DN68085_c0_g1_i1:271-4242(+)